MYTKEITYVDYDGNERTEKFSFNISRAELVEMNMSEQGGLEKLLQKIVAEQDSKRIFEIFKTMIMNAYGVKSLDGKRFEKSEELSKAFIQTEAYSVLVMEMLSDPSKAAEFINSIIPADMAKEAQQSSVTALPMA